MKIFYDIPYLKVIMTYVLIPVVIIVLIAGVCLFFYSKKQKDHEDPHYNFVMDFWSSLIGIIVTAAILALAIGFSVAMTEKMREYHLVEEKKMLYYLLRYFVILPFVFVIWYIVKFIKTIYYKIQDNKINSNNSLESESVIEESKEVEMENEPQEEVKVESTLPPIEETLQEEMKQFDAKPIEQKKDSTTIEEKPEIIDFEEEEKSNG